MATLLKYYFGQEVTEQEIVKEMIANGDAGKIRARGWIIADKRVGLWEYNNNLGEPEQKVDFSKNIQIMKINSMHDPKKDSL